MTRQQWTRDQVRGAIWTLEHLLGLAQLNHQEMDAMMGLLLPKLIANSGLEPREFRAIVAAMDPDEGVVPPTQH